MNYTLIRELLNLAESFESANQNMRFSNDLTGFKAWIGQSVTTEIPAIAGAVPKGSAAVQTAAVQTAAVQTAAAVTFKGSAIGSAVAVSAAAEPAVSEPAAAKPAAAEPDWDGKQNGRKPESVISTLIVHMNRYAKTYSKSVIQGSAFSTQEEFIYLITLRAYGEMTKTELIRKNIQEKPAGMLIVNRLVQQEWVEQVNSNVDKRSKVLRLTPKGAAALEQIRGRIDKATRIVSGDLTRDEQMELIRLLQKLEQFHHPIFLQNIDRAALLDQVTTALPHEQN